MTSEHLQIVKAYEELHLGVADIAAERELDEMEVKMCLMQFSALYRCDMKADKEGKKDLDFTDDQLEQANQVLHRLMVNSQDENLQYRAARYIRDDKKGRKDILKNLKKLNINVSVFNEQTMKNALQSLEASRVKITDKTGLSCPASPNPAPTIDVESEVKAS